MVKIRDPRCDRSGIILRSIRAEKAGKCIKKIIEKNGPNGPNVCEFNEKRLGLKKIDKDFFDEFKECSEDIKKEFIFLWEELHDLYEKLENYENNNEEVKIDNNEEVKIELDINKILKQQPLPSPKKNIKLFAP